MWIHTPWNISESVKKIAEDRDINIQVPTSKFKKSLQAAYDLEKLAIEKGVKIVEPFQGTSAFNNKIHVLGPDLDYYYELVAQFGDSVGGLSFASLFEKVINSITELWHEDQLVDPEDNAVSARNNSSVITLIQLDKTFLFLGDSGVPAISRAADYADASNFDLASQVRYVQVPHHGSKRNLGPTILNRIIGSIVEKGNKINKNAFISAAPDSPNHPSKRVINSFIRRGVDINHTCGQDHCYQSDGLPIRPGWVPLIPLEFYETYDED